MIKKIAPILFNLSLVSSILAAKKPNVLIFFIDDMGVTDLGINGSSFYETPHIDDLARSGVNFKNSYSAHPVCSPTRAALMSGKAPQRLGITQWLSRKDKHGLPLEEVTIAEAFKEAGYRTGYIGKWHLGKSDKFQPENQGFDYTMAVNRAGQPASFFFPFKKGKALTNVPDLTDYKDNDYLTDALTDKSIEFINQQSDKPFFLCPEYAAMIENLDTNVGRVMTAIKKKNLLEDTIIVFSSDNGGLVHKNFGPTSNSPYRSGKAWTYEGGIRIPTIISWPGKIQPLTTQTRTITMDLYPTLLELSDIETKDEQHIDGMSLKPILMGTGNSKALETRFLAWSYPHNHNTGHKPSHAILDGDWKLIQFENDEPVELYNLSLDIGETTNIANSNTDKVEELTKKLNDWLDKTTLKKNHN